MSGSGDFDGDLLGAARAGDGRAFARFYRRHLPGVVGFLMRKTGDHEVSADLAAEVFAAVFLSAGRYRSREGGSAGPWVRGIAQNKLRESRRRGRVEARARRKLGLEPEALDDADLARVDELASGQGVIALVEELPAGQVLQATNPTTINEIKFDSPTARFYVLRDDISADRPGRNQPTAEQGPER